MNAGFWDNHILEIRMGKGKCNRIFGREQEKNYICNVDKLQTINTMDTLQLNKRLFDELSVIMGNENKMRRAIKALHRIAIGTHEIKAEHLAVQERWKDYPISPNVMQMTFEKRHAVIENDKEYMKRRLEEKYE